MKGNGTTKIEGGKRQITRYLPPGFSCREFTVRELDGNDTLEIAVWTENSLPSVLKTEKARNDAELREAWRRSLVSVDGEPVNQHGAPYKEMDGWSQRTMLILIRAFNDLNGVETAEVEKIEAGAYSPTPPATKSSEGPAPRTAAPSAA